MLRWLVATLVAWVKYVWSLMSTTVKMSRGTKVTVHGLLAEGGFSFVYYASAGAHKFALKKMICQTPEQVSRYRSEVTRAMLSVRMCNS